MNLGAPTPAPIIPVAEPARRLGRASARAAAAPRHVSRARSILDYRHYPTFSWAWSWRRTVLFGSFSILVGMWQGTANGLLLDDARLGWTIAVSSAAIWVMMVATGPFLATAVRSRGWPLRHERMGVAAAVILAIAFCHGAQWVGTEISMKIVVPRALEQRVIDAAYLTRFRQFSGNLAVILAQTTLYFGLSGGLALVAYLGDQRRLARQTLEREFSALQLEREQADLELTVLQAQIEPHFLFNTLASLRSLLRQDIDRAEAMVDALVAHLRAALPVIRASRGQSTLAEQLALCTSYLDLMTIRLPDRLTYGIAVPPSVKDAPFPALMLLTLVENAVKHGIEPKPGPGHIRIDAARVSREDGPHLVVRVIDDGVGLASGLGHGLGLSNVRSQLALKYRGRAAFSLIGGRPGGTIARLDVPDDSAPVP